jgi:hypothetical protein
VPLGWRGFLYTLSRDGAGCVGECEMCSWRFVKKYIKERISFIPKVTLLSDVS